MAAEALLSSTPDGRRANARPPDTFLRRLAPLACAALAAAAFAAPTRAAELVEIRVGVHPGFTRVVFELDSEAGYSVARPAAEGASDELVVDLAAHSLRRVVTSRSDLVETVRIEPTEHGSVARIRLRGSAVAVADTLLLHPPRIVIDLRRPSPSLAAAETQSAQAEPGEPPASEPAPATEPGGVDEAAQAPSPPPLAEEPALTPDAESADAIEPEEAATAGAAETAPEEIPGEPSVMDEHAQELAGGETVPGEAPPPVTQGGEEAPETARAFEPEPTPAQAARPEAGTGRPVAAPGGSATGLPAPFDDPALLVAAAGALALMLLLVAVRSRRRRAQPRLPEFPPFEEEPDSSEEPVVEARAEDDLGPLAMPRARELGGETRPPQRSSIFDAGYDVEHEEDATLRPGLESAGEPSRSSGPGFAGAALPVPRASGAESDRRVEDLERRLAHLEKRLEEVSEVKDRLDRQLATQNEELRVQRAAIARTQRVLRNLSRPEDVATEPAPKGPGSEPPGGMR